MPVDIVAAKTVLTEFGPDFAAANATPTASENGIALGFSGASAAKDAAVADKLFLHQVRGVPVSFERPSGDAPKVSVRDLSAVIARLPEVDSAVERSLDFTHNLQVSVKPSDENGNASARQEHLQQVIRDNLQGDDYTLTTAYDTSSGRRGGGAV